MSNRATLTETVVTGALKSAIHDHGPITNTNIQSAVKRVVAQLRGAAKDVIIPEGEYAQKALVDHLHKRIEALKHGHATDRRNLTKQIEKLTEENARLRALTELVSQ